VLNAMAMEAFIFYCIIIILISPLCAMLLHQLLALEKTIKQNDTMQGFEHRLGLAEGISNRFLRTNRSVLVPSFEGIYKSSHHNNNHGGSVGLHDRLEELLVFEIKKNG
jgi:hypothetical protein